MKPGGGAESLKPGNQSGALFVFMFTFMKGQSRGRGLKRNPAWH